MRRRACVRGNLRSCPALSLGADTADLWVRRPECLCSENVRWRKLAHHCMEGPQYHALVQSIKSLDERKDVKGKDTFSLPEWWRCNSGSLPHFSFVLRALLTNAPNSCPPERLFSMFNATFGEDQRSAFGDYLELAMQSQYNKRNL